MIDRDYCVTMARYNKWQNREVLKMLETVAPDELTKDRGAFFGSILKTLNHLLWADELWLNRLEGKPGPTTGGTAGVEMTPTLAVWGAERFRLDGRLLLWAETIKSVDLVGDMTWYSGLYDREITKPRALCVMQIFNHQTHHRGQLHAMMTQAGIKTGSTDLPFIPEDI